MNNEYADTYADVIDGWDEMSEDERAEAIEDLQAEAEAEYAKASAEAVQMVKDGVWS